MSQKLIRDLNAIGAIKFGQFKLKSGQLSPIYIDLRILVSYPKVMNQIAKAYIQLLATLNFDRMAAVPYAALPIVAAISIHNGQPWIYSRKEAKDHGIKKPVEGEYQRGETVVVIDDLVTTGASKFETIEPFEAAGLRVKDIVVLLDRQQGAARILAKRGYRLHAIMTLSQVLTVLEADKIIDKSMSDRVKKFLADNQA